MDDKIRETCKTCEKRCMKNMWSTRVAIEQTSMDRTAIEETESFSMDREAVEKLSRLQ